MFKFIKRWIARKEIEKLHRYSATWQQYRRWLAEFPEIAIVLDNFEAEVNGKKSLNICWPPSETGPWSVSNLRDILRQRKENKCEMKMLDSGDWTKKDNT